MKSQTGFTLLELLLAVVISSILLSIAIVTINPAAQFAKARNTKRLNDVALILNAVGQYSSDHKGQLPASIPTGTALDITSSFGGANLCGDIMPTYMPALPSDPKTSGADITNCTSYDTDYTIIKDSYNRVTVSAPNVEPPSISITVTR